MQTINVLVIRNSIDCYALHAGEAFAPMIDSIPVLLSEEKDLRFITVTTVGSRVKLPNRNFYDFFFRIFTLVEKGVRKMFRLSRTSWYLEPFYWRRFLSRNTVMKVFCIEPSQSFLQACSELSIEVCEVQHGVVGVSHEHMKEDDRFPDFFLSWDHRSSENASKRSFNKTTSLLGCSMALHYYRSMKSQNLKSELNPRSKKKNVLVSLQWGLFGPHLYSELVLEDAYLPREVLEYMSNSTEHYNYIFRCHPLSKERGEVNQIFNSLREFGLAKSENEFEKVSDIPIFEILDVIDLHITLYSSVTIEAAFLGVPTILLDPALRKGGSREKYFEKEIENGMAVISDFDDLDFSFAKALRFKDVSDISIETRFKICEQSLKRFLYSN